MSIQIEGSLRAEGLRFDVVLSRFNDLYGERLLGGALDCLSRHGARDEDVRIVRVPGAFELPAMALRLAREGRADAIIALGVVIRGETPHFDHIASVVTKGLAEVAMATPTPLTFGVLTCDSADQAADRSGAKSGNKGWEAALAAIESANLVRKLGEQT